MKMIIYLEGGAKGELNARCREGFRKLFEKCGLEGKMPALVACGSRSQAFKNFKTEVKKKSDKAFIVLLVDSEDPVKDIEKPWEHLRNREGDKWEKPEGITDENVFLMTTCMETWIACDRDMLRKHYGSNFKESALPALPGIENKSRQNILKSLEKATNQKYSKGKHSFAILAKINPSTIQQYLPSFARMLRILREVLEEKG